MIVTLITDDDMWITRVALPMRTTNAQGEIMWNIWTFDNHSLTNVPEEGVSRLLSSKMLTRRGHYERFGLAFILEHGFMNTDQGRMCYEMNLVQIKNAILETLYYGGIEEYLMCKRHNELWTKRHGSRMSEHTVRETMQLEVDNWACIQKQDGGWDMLDSRSKRQLQDTGSSPNMWIIPRGMKPYIALEKAATSYFMRGPDGNALLDSAKNGQNVSYVDTSNSCQIFESKAFQMPGQEEPLDLLYRDRSVGEFYLMVDHLPEVSYKDKAYKTEHRTIYVYDERADRMKPITLKHALSNCTWPDGGPYGTEGDETDPKHNMFYCYDVDTKPIFRSVKRVKFLGELEKDYLTDDMIDKMTDVIAKLIRNGKSIKQLTTLTEQKALYEDIKNILGGDGLTTSSKYSPKLTKDSPKVTNKILSDDEKGFETFRQNALLKTDVTAAITNPYTLNLQGAALDTLRDVFSEAIDSKTSDIILDPKGTAITTTEAKEYEIDPEKYLLDVKYHGGDSPNIIITQRPAIKKRFKDLSKALATPINRRIFYALSILITNKYNQLLASDPKKENLLNKIVGRIMNIGQSHTTVDAGLWAMANVYTKALNIEKDTHIFDELFEEAYTPEKNKAVFDKTGLGFTGFDPVDVAQQAVDTAQKAFDAADATAKKATLRVLEKATEELNALEQHTADVVIKGRYITLNDTTLRGGERPGNRGLKRPAEAPLEDQQQRFGARVIFPDGRDHDGEGNMDIDAKESTGDVFTVNGVELNLGQMFKERYERIANVEKTNEMRRAIKLSILGMSFNKDRMKSLADKNIPVPVGVLAVRPFITHNMGTAILTTSGTEVGETLVGRADFQLTDNVVQKMHYGNFTFYARNIVYHPEKVLVVTDIISRRYIGGNDMQVFETTDDLDKFRNGAMNSHKSFIFMLIPCSQDVVRENPIDLTGRFEDTNSELDNLPLHYPNAQFYAKEWKFSHHQSNQNKDYFEYYNNLNTVCYQGHQMNYDPHQENYSRVTLNTGHWGYRVYEGCKAVRSGAMKLLKEVDYNSGSGPVPNVPLGY